MSDSQPQQESFDNSPPSSPAQSYLTILPSDSVSSTGIIRNPQDPIQLNVDPLLLQLRDVRHARSTQYPTRPPDIGSAISAISDLTDTPSSLLTPTVENTMVAHSNISTIPEHFSPPKKYEKVGFGMLHMVRNTWKEPNGDGDVNIVSNLYSIRPIQLRLSNSLV